MTETQTALSPKDLAQATINELGLTMTAQFVPWSQSRNAHEKRPSLNWLVTVSRNARPILTTDYMAGSGHCPSSKVSVKRLGHANSVMRHEAIKRECETGKAAGMFSSAQAIKPGICDVLYSLASDADVLNYSSFEDWASEFGYEPDSRKAEAVYRACLEIALKLRNALGEDGLAKLRNAFQDY